MTIREKIDKKNEPLTSRDLVEIGLFGTLTSFYVANERGQAPKHTTFGRTLCYSKAALLEFVELLENMDLRGSGGLPYAIRSGNVINKGLSALPVAMKRGPYVKSGKYSKSKELVVAPEHPSIPALNSEPVKVNLGSMLNHQFDSIKLQLDIIKNEWRLDHDLLNEVRKDMLTLQEENKVLNKRCTELHDRLQHLENELGVKNSSFLTRATNKLRGLIS